MRRTRVAPRDFALPVTEPDLDNVRPLGREPLDLLQV
jgi:hypothetical protein